MLQECWLVDAGPSPSRSRRPWQIFENLLRLLDEQRTPLLRQTFDMGQLRLCYLA